MKSRKICILIIFTLIIALFGTCSYGFETQDKVKLKRNSHPYHLSALNKMVINEDITYTTDDRFEFMQLLKDNQFATEKLSDYAEVRIRGTQTANIYFPVSILESATDDVEITDKGSMGENSPDALKEADENLGEEARDNQVEAIEEEKDKEDQGPLYHPLTDGTNGGSKAGTTDEIINEADAFVGIASTSGTGVVDQSELSKFSNILFNIVLAVGTVTAVIVGLILGVRFMGESAEGKAEVKKLLLPYLMGCIAVFGALAVWKIVVDILTGIF